jgi:predicted membrane protein
MLSLAIFSQNKIDGSALEPYEPVTCLALFGNLDLDLTDAPPDLEATVIAVFGNVKVRVRPEEEVMLDGLCLFGSRSVESRDPGTISDPSAENFECDEAPLPMELSAYSIFGNVSVKRGASWLKRVKRSWRLASHFRA